MKKISSLYNSLIGAAQAMLVVLTIVLDIVQFCHDKLHDILEALKHENGA